MPILPPGTVRFHRFKHLGRARNPGRRRGGSWLLAAILTIGLHAQASERVVVNVQDSGSGSLRTTVAEAADGDSIRFDIALSGQTVTLYGGPIVLDKRLSIDASTLPKGVTISGSQISRIFEIASSGSLALRALSLRAGQAPTGATDFQGNGSRGGDGGAIYNAGALTLSGCALFDSAAGRGGGNGLGRAGGGGNGGAIFSRGTLALSNCTLAGNSAGVRGAGSTGFDGFGGAICNVGTASLTACTIAGNGLVNGDPVWAGFAAETTPVGPVFAGAAPWAAAPPPPATVFLSPNGNDANAGTRAAPLRTTGAALAAIGGQGEIVLLAGDYQNLKFDLAAAGRLTIRADHGSIVRVFLGEKVTAFTHDSGFVWKATVAAGYDFTEGDYRLWVFEWGTPEGPIPPAAAQPLQRGLIHRLSSTRLVPQPNQAAVGAGPGRYWYDTAAHTLYLSASDGGDPNGRDYWIPSQTALQSLVFGGTPVTDITIEGVQVFFGRENVDLSYCRSYVVRSCLLFGSSDEGLFANPFGHGYEEDNEYAANANDGSGPANYNLPWSSLIVIDAWSHDNGDEGHSIHRYIEAAYFGGLFEYNASGGITPGIGAKFTAYGPYTRANTVGLYPAATYQDTPPVSISAISATNPAMVTTSGPHGLYTGEMVRIADVMGSSPDINGERVATVLGANTFSVALPQPAGATGGNITRLKGTSGTVCDWVSNADATGAYNPTMNGILTLLRPTVIAARLWAFHSGKGSTVDAYDPVLVSVVYPKAGGAGLIRLIYGTPIPNPVAENGAGLFTAGHLTIGNSIVAGNFAGNFGRWGSVTDLGSNLTAGDPRLTPLGDFGGPTPTMALRPSSPAYNAAVTATTATDQRNRPRPVGPPDIGAYEADNLTGFRAWSFENFPNIVPPLFTDDRNRNGICDGLDYALPGNTPETTRGLTLQTVQFYGQPTMAISFPYRVSAPDLIYIVERTTDLAAPVAWQEILRLDLSTGIEVKSGGITSRLDPLTGTARVFDTPGSSSAAPGTAPPKTFWRLRVEQTGPSK